MLLKSSRPPCGGQARWVTSPRHYITAQTVLSPPSFPSASHGLAVTNFSRPASALSAAVFDTAPSQDELLDGSHRVSALRVSAEAELESSTGLVTTKFIVPHFMTKPGQQLFLSGSTHELGEWDHHLAVPMEWQEGHQHTAVVRLPSSRVVQVKLVLKENGWPVVTEEGSPRDIMLLPITDDNGNASSGRHEQWSDEGEAEGPGGAAAVGPALAGPRLDYQIMCHFGNTDATQILRLPVVLPAREAGDRRVLCKFVVMLEGMKLEARQYPVIVGSTAELGSWKAENGVKLMRQVGGYWTRRVELPLMGDNIQAKVVICNPDGQPVSWEPGTSNRVLPARREGDRDSMYIFVCCWNQPGFTPVVSVPVEYEDASKEYIKMLDAAQKEIGLMRMAVTAKSRQVQSLESELVASRRAERTLREEVGGLRNEMGYLIQELEVAQKGELRARQGSADLQAELQQLRDNYERQISFLESKLDEMEHELITLQERLTTSHNGNGNNGNGNGHSPSYYEREEAPRVISRSNWR